MSCAWHWPRARLSLTSTGLVHLLIMHTRRYGSLGPLLSPSHPTLRTMDDNTPLTAAAARGHIDVVRVRYF